MKIAAVQMVSGPDLATNLATARRLLEEAARRGAQLAALPEYFCLMGMQDGATVFGIPQVGFRAQNGDFMERALVTPDVQVANDKSKLDAGEDQQLEAAVKSLLGK